MSDLKMMAGTGKALDYAILAKKDGAALGLKVLLGQYPFAAGIPAPTDLGTFIGVRLRSCSDPDVGTALGSWVAPWPKIDFEKVDAKRASNEFGLVVNKSMMDPALCEGVFQQAAAAIVAWVLARVPEDALVATGLQLAEHMVEQFKLSLEDFGELADLSEDPKITEVFSIQHIQKLATHQFEAYKAKKKGKEVPAAPEEQAPAQGKVITVDFGAGKVGQKAKEAGADPTVVDDFLKVLNPQAPTGDDNPLAHHKGQGPFGQKEVLHPGVDPPDGTTIPMDDVEETLPPEAPEFEASDPGGDPIPPPSDLVASLIVEASHEDKLKIAEIKSALEMVTAFIEAHPEKGEPLTQKVIALEGMLAKMEGKDVTLEQMTAMAAEGHPEQAESLKAMADAAQETLGDLGIDSITFAPGDDPSEGDQSGK